MLYNLALHFGVSNQIGLLQVLVKYQTLKPHLVLVGTVSSLAETLIPSNKVEQDDAQVVAKLVILVSDNLMDAWELDFFLLN